KELFHGVPPPRRNARADSPVAQFRQPADRSSVRTGRNRTAHLSSRRRALPDVQRTGESSPDDAPTGRSTATAAGALCRTEPQGPARPGHRGGRARTGTPGATASRPLMPVSVPSSTAKELMQAQMEGAEFSAVVAGSDAQDARRLARSANTNAGRLLDGGEID